jgi:hypothetical protein
MYLDRLQAGEKAVSCGAPKASELDELKAIKELHFRCALIL